jgi:hypothetical protein
MAALSLAAALLFGEMLLRMIARQTPEGVAIGETILQRTWSEQVQRNREAILRATPSGLWTEPVFTYDPALGWTVGKNRTSKDGMYHTSVEGLRAPAADYRYDNTLPLRRIAIIGDSNAFSLEVPFEDSWAYHLERNLDAQVLNFGVNGYGIDQTLLRFIKDVAPWKPDIVILGVIQSNFVRTMAVYSFITFPSWDLPFSKPRFVLESGQLVRLNDPTIAPEQIVEASNIDDLPYLDKDYGYNWADWDWRFNHAPYLYRFLTSLSPRYASPLETVSVDAIRALNAQLLRRIVEAAQANGSEMLLLYLPPTLSITSEELAKSVLAEARLPFTDMSSCISNVPLDKRLVPSGHHYTGAANEALAKCTAELVQDMDRYKSPSSG